MAKPGRKPKPTALKLLAGTRADRVNKVEPPADKGVPEPPDHLDKIARDEWARITPLLERMGVLCTVDGAALALYCDSYSRWLRARGDVMKRGMVIETEGGGVKLNPSASVITSAMKFMKDILCEFGCTPSSRSGLSGGSGQPKDALAEFLGPARSSR